MVAQHLKGGETVELINEDETMHAEVFFSEHLDKYIIELNGKFMCTSKTFAPMQTRLNNLKAKHGLYEV